MDEPPPRPGTDRVRVGLIAGSVAALLVVVLLRGDTDALLAVAGLVGVLCGVLVLLRRGRAAAKGRRGAWAVLAVGAAGLFLGGTAFGAEPAGTHLPAPSVTPTATTPAAIAALEALPVRPALSRDGYRRALFGASRSIRNDRVVTLVDAWRTGAAALPAATRAAFADDPGNVRVAPAAGCGTVAARIAVKRAYGLWVTPAEHATMRSVLAGCPAQALPVVTPPSGG